MGNQMDFYVTRFTSTFGNARCKTPMFSCLREEFTGNQELQGNDSLKPEESPVHRWFCIVSYLMSPYD